MWGVVKFRRFSPLGVCVVSVSVGVCVSSLCLSRVRFARSHQVPPGGAGCTSGTSDTGRSTCEEREKAKAQVLYFVQLLRWTAQAQFRAPGLSARVQTGKWSSAAGPSAFALSALSCWSRCLFAKWVGSRGRGGPGVVRGHLGTWAPGQLFSLYRPVDSSHSQFTGATRATPHQ